MLTGKEYLDSIQNAIKEEVDTELQRLQYFLKANARVHNTRFPFIFPVKNCRLEVIDSLAATLTEAGWNVEKGKEYLKIMPMRVQPNQVTLPALPRK